MINLKKDITEEIINEDLFNLDIIKDTSKSQLVANSPQTDLPNNIINIPDIAVAFDDDINEATISNKALNDQSINRNKFNSFLPINTKKLFKILTCLFISSPVLIVLIGRLIFPDFSFIIHVSSESMQPTLNINEDFFVLPIKAKSNNISYGVYGFYSKEKNINMVKRLIGLPNDHIEFKEGILYRNGSLVKEPYVLYEDIFSCTFDVPADKYLFLGDNRSNSLDARYWDEPYIDATDIKCKIIARISPYYKIGLIK